MEFKGSGRAKTALKKKNQVIELIMYDFKTYFEVIVFKVI